MAFSEGTLVSGYRISRVLGTGGMGTVYLAANPVLPRQDALKVLSAELSRDPAFRARFQREADLAATLDHPNIVTVYTRGESEDGQLWIAMQYVAGSDALKELQEGRMTVDRAVAITSDVAKALDYAHRRNLVHRDVKPANFLLDPDGERALLADFGIARALDDSESLTMTGTVMATIAYAAPETLSGGRVDGRADIYALACSLFMLLTGRTPFASAGGMHAVMAAHLYQPPPRVTEQAPHLPTALDGVFARAMAKNPAERHQSAREFVDAVRGALHGGPMAGPPPGPVPGAMAHSLPPTAAWGTPPPGTIAQPVHPVMPPAPRRRRRWPWAAAAVPVVVAVVAATTLMWPTEEEPGYSPTTFHHERGTTELTAAPTAVAALGPGDGGAVLALGVQPVAIVAPEGRLPSWDRRLVTGNPAVLATADPAALASVGPDVIIDTGTVDAELYTSLSDIAPTITRQANISPWTWREQVTWIGRILGRDDQAQQLIDGVDSRHAELRSTHPAFSGKVIEVVHVDDSGVSVVLSDAPIAGYLESLGFDYADQLRRSGTDVGDVRILSDPAAVNDVRTDVRVVVRTDSAAADGGYNGLPRAFTQYGGATVIVDAPELVAAMATVDYGAVGLLDDALVTALARQVH